MSKWYETVLEEPSNIIYSRIRLARNWNEYVFPSQLDEAGSRELIDSLRDGLSDIGEKTGNLLSYRPLETMGQAEKKALRERRILNRCAVEKTCAQGLYLSQDESESILLGADDHTRLQLLASGLCLEKLWQKADGIDDAMNEHFPYAFDEKYGYLTTFPTNMGTGLKACVVVHLPMLSKLKKFQSIVADMGRLGTSIRGIFGEDSENAGSMYEVSNQRTLGLSEKEIIELVNKAAIQLNSQESKVRKAALNSRRLEREDETYKSYGVLKYARKMAEKDARVFIGQLIAGETDGLTAFEKENSLYSLLVGIKPANLNLWVSRPLDKEETDCVRAAYIREHLPQILS